MTDSAKGTSKDVNKVADTDVSNQSEHAVPKIHSDLWRMKVRDGRWTAIQAPRPDGREVEALEATHKAHDETIRFGVRTLAAMSILGVAMLTASTFLSPLPQLIAELLCSLTILAWLAVGYTRLVKASYASYKMVEGAESVRALLGEKMALPVIRRDDFTGERARHMADRAAAATSSLRSSPLIEVGRKNVTESVALSAALYQYLADLYVADSMLHRDEQQATELLDSLERVLDDYTFAVAQAKVTHHITIPLTGLDEDMSIQDITDAIDQTLRINNQSQGIGRKVASLPPLLAVENPRTNNPQEDK